MQKKLNLTKTVRKLPIDENLERAGHYIHDDRQIEIKYDAANWVSDYRALILHQGHRTFITLKLFLPAFTRLNIRQFEEFGPKLSHAYVQTAPIGTEDYSKPVTAAQLQQILEHYPIGQFPAKARPCILDSRSFHGPSMPTSLTAFFI